MPSVGILGTGLIGASIGQGLAAAGWDTHGWDPDEATLAKAGELGAIATEAASSGELLSSGLDVIVLAGPPDSVEAEVAEMDVACLVMDVAGVKSGIVGAARPARFVGTHPMAGREQAGPAMASPALFRGAAWIVVADGANEEDVLAVEEIIETLRARPIRMTAVEHDATVAVISHVPQLLAGTLLQMAASREGAMDLAAGSFRDLTRVAASDPAMWTQLLLANADEVVGAVEALRERLSDVVRAVAASDGDAVHSMLSSGRELRMSLAAPVVGVRIALRDEPGELARVGRALGRSAVDVRDLQLRHAPFGGGGILTISVRPGEAEALVDAARVEGLQVED